MARRYLAQRIADRIRCMVRDDPSMVPGARISSRALAERLKQSVSTVRRAVKLLESEGLLSSQAGSGVTLRVSAHERVASGPEPPAANSRGDHRLWALVLRGGSTFMSSPGCYHAIYDALSDAVLRRNEGLLVWPAPAPPEHFGQLGVSGIVLLSVFVAEHQRRYAGSAIPAVVLDDVPKVRGVDYVVADNRRGAELIARRLVKFGHRRIAFVRSLVQQSDMKFVLKPDGDSLERGQFLRTALRRRGLDLPDRLIYDAYGARLRRREMTAQHILMNKPMPTAVVTSGESRAVTLVRVFRQAGLRVPQDISVAAFCTPGHAEENLSGVEIDFEEMARLGMERLRRRAEGAIPKGTSRRILAPVSLREGVTWGPVGK